MTLGERIKKVRKALDLTQQKFAERLGVKQNTIALIESGKRNTSGQLLFGICREFSVNETWLRSGEGEMFLQTTPSQEIADFVGKIMVGEQDTFKRRFVAMLARLDESEWEFIERKALELFEDTKKD